MAGSSLWRFEPSLQSRDVKCVQCPPGELVCPTCPSGQVCVQISQDCNQCASRKCVPNSESGATQGQISSGGGGPNIGAIVGGVVGGIIFIAIVVWLIWRFYLKPRRDAQWQSYYEDEKTGGQRGQYGAGTRHSMASTANTHESNVIQIAFIPGVTDRSDEAYTPPVPPIPASQPNSPYTDASGDHYFMPGDLRDSTYSGFTDDGASTIDRRSVAGRSIAPSIAPSLLRQSVASGLFHEDATLQSPAPAQTALRGRANVVSVKVGSGNVSRAPSVPAVPKLDIEKYRTAGTAAAAAAAGDKANNSSNALSAPNSASATPIAATVPLLASTSATNLSSPVSVSTAPAIQVTSDSASDMSAHTAASDLQTAIEEAARRASQQPVHGGLGSVAARDPSPFSDANRLSEASINTDDIPDKP